MEEFLKVKTPQGTYRLDIDAQGYATCTCPAFAVAPIEGPWCPHLQAAWEMLPGASQLPTALLLPR